MGLRPGRTMRRLERPYTRVSIRVTRKSYVKGVPGIKIHHFEMGNKNGEFDLRVLLVAKNGVQIRHNALEAGRISAHKFLEKKLGTSRYFMKILVYPHHVIREKPVATGAGADRYSQGMRLAFGKPVGRAVQTYEGQRLVEVRVNKEHLDIAKKALKRFSQKIPAKTQIIVEEL